MLSRCADSLETPRADEMGPRYRAKKNRSDHVPAVDTNRAYHMLLMDTEAIVSICTAAPDVLDTYSGCRNSLYMVRGLMCRQLDGAERACT